MAKRCGSLSERDSLGNSKEMVPAPSYSSIRARFLCHERQAACRAVRCRESGRCHDRRCRAGGKAGRRRRHAAPRPQAQGSDAGGHRGASESAPPLGLLSLDRSGAALSGQAYRGEAGRRGLSLHLHHHRAEHWVVVRGAARVTIGDETKILHENESTYIPSGAKHRLENPGKIELELIEVQTGSYLGEDDIVRIEDDYRRS